MRTPVSREELAHDLELVDRHHGGFLLNSFGLLYGLGSTPSAVVLKLPNAVPL